LKTGSGFGCYSFGDHFACVASTESGRRAAAQHPRLCAKYCGFAIPSCSLPAYRTGADSLPARQPLSPRPCGSFGLQALSAIFLIALKVKTQDLKIMVLTLKFKSTFELPNEE
jgi:hypothetical protein